MNIRRLMTVVTTVMPIALFLMAALLMPVPNGEWRDPKQSLFLSTLLLFSFGGCMDALNSYRTQS